MHPWVKNAIKGSFKSATAWAAVAWMGEKLRKQVMGVQKQLTDETEKLKEDYLEAIGLPTNKKSKKILERAFEKAPETMKRVVREVSKGEIMEKKKSWSFFKVILVLGIVVAVAVFLLDRILPKPYRDEELEEAWNEDNDTEDDVDEVVERPMAAEAVSEPDEGVKAEVVEEKPKKKAAKKSTKKEAE